MSKKIILIAGPTASGKSNLAILLAKKINGEIINADSMQIYKEFNILSSRPSNEDLKKIKHHLYGFISVKKNFSVGQWLKLVKKKVKHCLKSKKTPVIVGGTGLYFKAITKGISQIPEISKRTRNQIRKLHKEIGPKKFYELLVKIDPMVKKNLLSSDTQRVLRAYEVKLVTKKSIFQWALNTKSEFLDYNIKKIFINIPREELLKKISERTETMFNKKCVNEVKKFCKLKANKSLSAHKLIGVSEINNYLKGTETLTKTKELIAIKTRQYAKRQNTWSRGHMNNWNKLYSKDFSILLKKVLKVVS